MQITMSVKSYLIGVIITSALVVLAYFAIDYYLLGDRTGIRKRDVIKKIDDRSRDLDTHSQQTQRVIIDIDHYLDNNPDWRQI